MWATALRPDPPKKDLVPHLADKIVTIENIFKDQEFLWEQHTKLCTMTLPFLSSVIIGFLLGTATISSLRSRLGLLRFPLEEFQRKARFSNDDKVNRCLKTKSKDLYAEGI